MVTVTGQGDNPNNKHEKFQLRIFNTSHWAVVVVALIFLKQDHMNLDRGTMAEMKLTVNLLQVIQ